MPAAADLAPWNIPQPVHSRGPIGRQVRRPCLLSLVSPWHGLPPSGSRFVESELAAHPRPPAIQPPATDISFELVELVRPVAQSDSKPDSRPKPLESDRPFRWEAVFQY